MNQQKKPISFLQKLKEKQTQDNLQKEEAPKMGVAVCPACGAGRAKQDGLTHCAYCGFEFLSVTLTDGLYLKKEDNSNNKNNR